MDVRVKALAARQFDLVAAWQLKPLGWNWNGIRHAVTHHGWHPVHPGVYALTSSALTAQQRWMAATLTTPDSVLSHASAAAFWDIRRPQGGAEVVTRPGSGGRRRLGGVLVLRSATLDGEVTNRHGIPVTTGARTLIDLAPHLGAKQLGRAVREALRLKTTSARLLQQALRRHRSRRGTAALRALATRYASIPYHRTRSDAEGRALELLHDAGVDAPRVNVQIAGEEADLVWPARRLIVEVDGPQYHRFPDEDARKEAAWRAAGYEVRRIGSGALYDERTAQRALREIAHTRARKARAPGR